MVQWTVLFPKELKLKNFKLTQGIMGTCINTRIGTYKREYEINPLMLLKEFTIRKSLNIN